MDDIIIDDRITVPASAVRLRFSRSGGKGGQHVNKVSTRVEMSVALSDVPMPDGVRQRLLRRLGHAVDAAGLLRVVAQGSRSQWQNRMEAEERVRELFREGLKEVKARRATRPTASSKRERVEGKKRRGDTKRLRRERPGDD